VLATGVVVVVQDVDEFANGAPLKLCLLHTWCEWLLEGCASVVLELATLLIAELGADLAVVDVVQVVLEVATGTAIFEFKYSRTLVGRALIQLAVAA
jgi:hypothetical protein